MLLTNCLIFDGNCREAFEAYAALFGGKVEFITNKDLPPDQQNPWAAERPDKIMHAWLQTGDQALMGNDCPPEFFKPMGGFNVGFHTKDVDEARRVFDALSQGGQVSMPFEATFWSLGFGLLTDRFGVPWVINTYKD